MHIGHERSFVYDIADLYKAEIIIPLAFEIAAENPEDLPSVMRRRTRDAMVKGKILRRMVRDIQWLLTNEESSSLEGDVIYLWDELFGKTAAGVAYTEERT